MNYDLKLALLANELKATVKHADEVFTEYIATAVEKATMDAIDELSDEEKALLLIGLMVEGKIEVHPEPEPEEEEESEIDSRIQDFIKALDMLETAMRNK